MDELSRVRRALGQALPERLPTPNPLEDLVRAQSAARVRSRRRFRVGLSALALALVAGVGAAGVIERDTGPEAPAITSAAGPIDLLAMRLQAKPYTFDLTPQGWSVQARTPYFVTIVPDDGSTSPDPDVFVGKLVITFDHNAVGGRLLPGPGRRIRIHGDSGYTTLSMRTTTGEPAGVVRIQYPDDAGWDRASMARFLRSVHVGPGAKASLG
jgi:hypothetical protein